MFGLCELSWPVLGISLLPLLLILAVTNPRVLLVATFLLTPYQMPLLAGWGSAEGGVVDVLALCLCVPLAGVCLSRRRVVWGPALSAILVYLLVALGAMLLHWDGTAAILSFVRMVAVTLLPALFFSNLDVDERLISRCLNAYLVGCAVVVIAQVLAFARGGFEPAMYALGLNKNFIGAIMACAIGVTLVQLLAGSPGRSRRALLATAIVICSVGLVLCLSRGAWLATAGGVCLLAVLTRRTGMLAGAIVLAAVTAAIAWSVLPETATTYALDIDMDSSNIRSRLDAMDVAYDAFRESPILGMGIALRKVTEPHNVLVLTLAESGVLGLAAFLAMFTTGFHVFFRTLARARPSQRVILLAGIAVLAISLFHGLFDVYWRRGVAFMAWGLVGAASAMANRQSTASPPWPRRVASDLHPAVSALE